MKRSGRGRGDRERVEAARRQAALALGRDPDRRDAFIKPPSSVTPLMPRVAESMTLPATGHAIGALTMGEAAARLGMSRAQLERLIDRGAVKALPTGHTRMIPAAEVQRLESLTPRHS